MLIALQSTLAGTLSAVNHSCSWVSPKINILAEFLILLFKLGFRIVVYIIKSIF